MEPEGTAQRRHQGKETCDVKRILQSNGTDKGAKDVQTEVGGGGGEGRDPGQQGKKVFRKELKVSSSRTSHSLRRTRTEH